MTVSKKQVAVWAYDSPMPIYRASGMAEKQGQSTCVVWEVLP